mgnify:CR=1 FL=1
MKSGLFCVACLFVFAASTTAQVSPTPVINNEMRDINSDRRRSLELERVKRERVSPFPRDLSEAEAIRFAKINEDFEGIQKVQTEIIKVYQTGTTIDYQKIGELALELRKKALRLRLNLFEVEADAKQKERSKKKRDVAKLIVELDKSIAAFVDSPIFKSRKLVSQNDAEKSEAELEQVINLSGELSREANPGKK